MAKTAHEKIVDKVVKNTVDLERIHEGLQQKVYDLLSRTESDIILQIIDKDPTYPSATVWKQKRLLKLLTNVNDVIEGGYSEIKKTAVTELKKLGKIEAAKAATTVNTAVGADLLDVTLTPQDLEAIVTSTLVDGQTIGKWWSEQSKGFQNKFAKQMRDAMEQIQLGLVRGEAIGELVKRVRGSTELPGMMSNVRREATALVRTSVMQTANESRKAVYKANEDLIKGYEVVATLDRRTSPICRALDGKLFDLEFQPIGHSIQYPGGPPFHWNCRSTLVPILKSYSELAGPKSKLKKAQINKLNKLDKSQRASMSYTVRKGEIVDSAGKPVKATMTYDEWLRKQPVAVQKDVLGIKKQRLWKEHNLSMADMVSQKGRALTIEDLIDEMVDEAAMAAGAPTVKGLVLSTLEKNPTYEEMFDILKKHYTTYGAKGIVEITDDFIHARMKNIMARKWYKNFLKEKGLKGIPKPGVAPPPPVKPKPPRKKPPKPPKPEEPIVPPEPSAPFEVPEKFVKAKTFREAQERARSLNLGTITTGGLNEKVAMDRINDLLEETENLFRRFPKLQEITNRVPMRELALQSGDSFVSRSGNVVFGTHSGGRIRIATAVHKTPSLKIDKRTFAVGHDYRSYFRHEYGHYIDWAIDYHAIAVEGKRTVKTSVHKFFDSLSTDNKRWSGKNLSKYSATNYKEFFAEAFSAYTSPLYGIKQRLPEALEKAFEELIGPHTELQKTITRFFRSVELTSIQRNALQHIGKNGVLGSKQIDELYELYGPKTPEKFQKIVSKKDIEKLSQRINEEIGKTFKPSMRMHLKPGSSEYKDLFSNGNIKNQFELGEKAKSGGYLGPYKGSARDDWEHWLFGRETFESSSSYRSLSPLGRGTRFYTEKPYLSDYDAKQRPIYGYLDSTGKKEAWLENRVSQYGNVKLVLKEEIKDRMSFTLSNSSVSSRFVRDRQNGHGGTAENNLGLLRNALRLNSREEIADFISGRRNRIRLLPSDSPYIETQIFGGVNFARDVAEVIVPDFGSLGHLEKLCEKYGVKLTKKKEFWYEI